MRYSYDRSVREIKEKIKNQVPKSIDFLRRLIEDPNQFLYVTWWKEGKQLRLFPALAECACVLHDRTRNHRRAELQQNIINDMVSQFPPHQQQSSLVYLSLGCGKLLQDFLIVGELLLKGYKDLTVILIDPTIQKNLSALRHFKSLSKIAEKLGARIQTQYYVSLKEYQSYLHDCSLSQDIHLISAIDYESFFKDRDKSAFLDLINAHRMMHPKGRCYLSQAFYEFHFSKNACLKIEMSQSVARSYDGLIKQIKKQDHLKRKSSIYYACFSPMPYGFQECIDVLCCLVRYKPREINLLFLSPTVLDRFHMATGEINKNFNEESLKYFFRLFIPDVNFNFKLIDSFDSFKNKIQSSCDIVTLVRYPTPSIFEANQQIKFLKNNMQESVRYYLFRVPDLNKNNWIEKRGCEIPNTELLQCDKKEYSKNKVVECAGVSDEKLEVLKKEIAGYFDSYISCYKLNMFGHHHNGRAKVVKKAVMEAKSMDDIREIIVNQKSLLINYSNNPSKLLPEAYSQQLVNQTGNIKKSGYYTVIYNAEVALSKQNNIPEVKFCYI